MYCRLCDIEYPKSLRFCKWCGGGLVAREAVSNQHCPSCSSEIEKEWVFCNECGVDLATLGAQPRDIVCPACSATVRKGWMFCRQCGEQVATERASDRCEACGAGVRTTWNYCKECAAPLKAQPEAPGGGFRTIAGIPALPPEELEAAPFSNLKSGELPPLEDVIRAKDPRAASAAFPQEAAPRAQSEALPSGTRPLSTSRSTGHLDSDALDQEIRNHPVSEPPVEAHVPTPAAFGRLEASELIDPVAPRAPEADSTKPYAAISAEAARSLGPDDVTVNMESPFSTPNSTPALPPQAASGPGAEATQAMESPFAPPPPPDATRIIASPIAPDVVEPQVPSYEQTPSASPAFSPMPSEPLPSPQTGYNPYAQPPQPPQPSWPPPDQPAAPPYPPPPQPTVPLPPSNVWPGSSNLNPSGAPTTFTTPPPPQPPQPSWPPPLPPPNSHPSYGHGTGSVGAQSSFGQPAMNPAVQHSAPFPPAAAPAPARGSSLKWIVLGLVVIVLLGVGTVGAVLAWRAMHPTPPIVQTPPVETPPVETPPTTPPVQTPSTPTAPDGMVYVAGGAFQMGTDDPTADPFSLPAHAVDVKPFFLDSYEVTNADYKRFVDATGHAPPKEGWVNGEPTPGSEKWPVVQVTWDDAVAYAKWAEKRLPTEAEWEFAARGTDGRRYPWGNDWDPAKGNLGKDGKQGTLAPVGSVEAGKSPAGAYDMLGNVWEWTASPFKIYPGGTATPPDGKNLKIIRGGAFDNTGRVTTVYRGYYSDNSALPKVGFRCAKDLP